MNCLLLSNDLVFGSHATQAARNAGYEVSLCGDAVLILEKPLDDIQLVLADLTTPNFDAKSLAHHFRSSIEVADEPDLPRLVAIGPHVHTAKLEAARAAGWQVFTRGQFHTNAPAILKGQEPSV